MSSAKPTASATTRRWREDPALPLQRPGVADDEFAAGLGQTARWWLHRWAAQQQPIPGIARVPRSWGEVFAYWLSCVDYGAEEIAVDAPTPQSVTDDSFDLDTDDEPPDLEPGPQAADVAAAHRRAVADWEAARPRAAAFLGELGRAAAARRAVEKLSADQHAMGRQKAEERLAIAEAALSRQLPELIALGLRRRVGLYLDELDAAVFNKLERLRLGLGAPPAEYFGCCEGCGVVFESKRRHASRCPRCHGKPRTPMLGFEHRDDGGRVFYTPLTVHRVHRCERCEVLFNTRSPRARRCPGCRT